MALTSTENPAVAVMARAHSVAQLSGGVAAATRLRREGFAQFDDVWSKAVAVALADEALRVWPSAKPPEDGQPTRAATSRPGTGKTLRSSGPLIERIHRDLVPLARSASGQLLLPSWSGYYYYDGDDEMRLHLDTPLCDLTMITTVLGTLGALHLHPELDGRTVDELKALEADPSWDRSSGVPVIHTPTGVTVFRGRRLPHHRPGQAVEGVGAVAAFHYRRTY